MLDKDGKLLESYQLSLMMWSKRSGRDNGEIAKATSYFRLPLTVSTALDDGTVGRLFLAWPKNKTRVYSLLRVLAVFYMLKVVSKQEIMEFVTRYQISLPDGLTWDRVWEHIEAGIEAAQERQLREPALERISKEDNAILSPSTGSRGTPLNQSTIRRLGAWGLLLVIIGLCFVAGFSSWSMNQPSLPCQRMSAYSPDAGFFDAQSGLTLYDSETTQDGLIHNRVRAIAIDARGVWFGYFPSDTSVQGLGFLDGKHWFRCEQPEIHLGENVNDIAIVNGDVWTITDGFGASVLRENMWKGYTSSNGLIDNRGYIITGSPTGNVLVGTWEGISVFEENHWTTPYRTSQTGTLINDHVDAISVSPNNDLWIGYIDAGLSYKTAEERWVHYTAQETPEVLLNNNIRALLNTPEGDLWVATSGGGVSYRNASTQTWSLFTTENSALPSDDVSALARDHFGRIWAATQKGVSYFDGKQWQFFAPIEVFDIAFGPSCEDCPFRQDDLWFATPQGLAHGHIPALLPVVRVEQVFFPPIVRPGERVVPRIRVQVLASLGAGDALFFVDPQKSHRFGMHPVIAVKEPVDAGKIYEFIDIDNPLQVPETPGIYRSLWRVWVKGAYASEIIPIVFKVVKRTEIVVHGT